MWKETVERRLNQEMKCLTETIRSVKEHVMKEITYPVQTGFYFLWWDVDHF